MIHSVFLTNKDSAPGDEECTELKNLKVVLGPPKGPLGLLHQGDSFRAAADILQRKITLTDNLDGLAELLVPTIVLRGFAAECVLKAILAFTNGEYERTHDLSRLYSALHPTAKDLIEGIAKQQGKASPKTVLEHHKGDFTNWRYPGGLEGTEIDLADLDSIIEVLRHVSKVMAKAHRLQTDPELLDATFRKCPNCAQRGVASDLEWGGFAVGNNPYRLVGPALVCPACSSTCTIPVPEN